MKRPRLWTGDITAKGRANSKFGWRGAASVKRQRLTGPECYIVSRGGLELLMALDVLTAKSATAACSSDSIHTLLRRLCKDPKVFNGRIEEMVRGRTDISAVGTDPFEQLKNVLSDGFA